MNSITFFQRGSHFNYFAFTFTQVKWFMGAFWLVVDFSLRQKLLQFVVIFSLSIRF